MRTCLPANQLEQHVRTSKLNGSRFAASFSERNQKTWSSASPTNVFIHSQGTSGRFGPPPSAFCSANGPTSFVWRRRRPGDGQKTNTVAVKRKATRHFGGTRVNAPRTMVLTGDSCRCWDPNIGRFMTLESPSAQYYAGSAALFHCFVIANNNTASLRLRLPH